MTCGDALALHIRRLFGRQEAVDVSALFVR